MIWEKLSFFNLTDQPCVPTLLANPYAKILPPPPIILKGKPCMCIIISTSDYIIIKSQERNLWGVTGEKTTKMNALKPGYFFTIQMPQSSSLVKVHTYRLQMDWNWWCSLHSDRLCADCGLSRPEPWPHIGRPLAQRTGNWPVIKNIYTEYLQECQFKQTCC